MPIGPGVMACGGRGGASGSAGAKSASGFGVTSGWYGVSGSDGASAAGAGMLCSAAGGGTFRSGLDLSLVKSNAALIMSKRAATTMSSDILCCPGSAVTRLVSSVAAGCLRAASRCDARAAAACAARRAAATKSSVSRMEHRE